MNQSFTTICLYKKTPSTSLSNKASLPYQPGTKFLGLIDQNCRPANPQPHTPALHIHLLLTHSTQNLAMFLLLLLLEQSTDPLSKHQASSAAVYNLTTASSVQILAQPKSHSQPKPGSQVGQPWEPYPSWSFIWYCLKGTRGSSRT